MATEDSFPQYNNAQVADLIPYARNSRTHSDAQVDKIAAEQLGRKCYGMEISSQYCDVIIKRWQDFTGQQAVHERSGNTFAEVANA